MAIQKYEKKSIGFVPTMGALHAGHLFLINASQKENDITVCSIFVNPTQFNNKEDLLKYPRLPEKDILMLQRAGCTVLFMPEADEMYKQGEIKVKFNLNRLDTKLEGEFRPGHFEGVATIVKKLFDAVMPDRAYFGLKDYQQVLVVKQLVKQFSLPLTIVAVETQREENGLAMSSRNLRLTDDERNRASVIYKTLLWAKAELGKMAIPDIEQAAKEKIIAVPGHNVEYFEIADAETLEKVSTPLPGEKLVALTAVNVGPVRLIDNLILN